MILYHGSNVAVPEPRLLAIQRELDFGKGFYTTTDYAQAARWGSKTALRLKQEKAYVTAYEVEDEAFRALDVLRFDKPDAAWLRFVSACRRGDAAAESWDVICGPVANDQTMPVLSLYLAGRYDEEEAIKRLLPQKLKDQYTFKTERAIRLLRLREVISL